MFDQWRDTISAGWHWRKTGPTYIVAGYHRRRNPLPGGQETLWCMKYLRRRAAVLPRRLLMDRPQYSLRKVGAVCVCTIFLAACETPPDQARTLPSGQTVIDIRSGLNCYDGQCFNYDASRGLVAVNGRRATTPPVAFTKGSITPAEFTAVFDKCMVQPTRGSGAGGRD